MNTIIKKMNEDQINEECIELAARILQSKGLVAFPTETVYGLGADALDEQASAKIYKAKGRPSDNPLIVHIASIESLSELSDDVPAIAYKLAEKYWPGPLTMIMRKSKRVPFGTTGGLNTVAIRMPCNKIALQLIKQSGVYIAAPSANTSGRPSPTKAEHVIEDLNGKIDMIIDGGSVGIGLESTIIDLTSAVPTILRPGFITKEMLEETISEVEVDHAILSKNIDKNLHPKAPGMKYKHYAPNADLRIVEGQSSHVVSKINMLVEEKQREGFKVAVIATDETYSMYHADFVRTIGSRNDKSRIGRELYSVLRECDQEKVDFIYSEGFSESDFGQAIMNRLLKAAGYQVIMT